MASIIGINKYSSYWISSLFLSFKIWIICKMIWDMSLLKIVQFRVYSPLLKKLETGNLFKHQFWVK